QNLSLAALGVGTFILKHAVDSQFDRVPLARDLVLVPFADRLLDARFLHAVVVNVVVLVLARLIDRELETVYEPEIACVIAVELGLDAPGPDLVRSADVDEDAAVALVVVAFGRPAPLHLEHVIGELLVGDQVAIGLSLADEDAVLDKPDRLGLGVFLRIEKDLPARQVLAVEELDRGSILVFGHDNDQGGYQGDPGNLAS